MIDTETYTVVTNMRDGEPIDRIYGGAAGSPRMRLVQADGTEYQGKITKKTIIVDGINGKFKSYIYVTEDKRVFDRMGLPVYNVNINEVTVEENEDATQDQSDV